MLAFLPAPLKGVISLSLVILNTIFWCLCLYMFAVLKLIAPMAWWRRLTSRVMVRIADNWVGCNSWNIALTQSIRWQISGLEGLDQNSSYLVCANHQSWADIVVLQHVFHRQIPFLRFFLKRNLLYVPFLGLAWWALDFPFMRRHSKAYLQKHPESRHQDRETTRRACERYKHAPTSILNFLEGTRFSHEKHRRSASPFKHLLSPKAGGVAYVLDAMGEQFAALLDVTIIYPVAKVTLWDLLCGRIGQVTVIVRQIPIPRELIGVDYTENSEFRLRMAGFVRELWESKDQLMEGRF